MEELNNVIAGATRHVGAGYFQLQIDGGGPMFRERVYCYELYHQMRLTWPENCPYVLNGEIDKRAHPILRWLGAANSIPDFLVHTPGAMAGNHAIIEVKSSNVSRSGIRCDLRKLSAFKTSVGYERGIYLFYGFNLPALDDLIDEVRLEIEDFSSVEIWHHHTPGQAAVLHRILE